MLQEISIKSRGLKFAGPFEASSSPFYSSMGSLKLRMGCNLLSILRVGCRILLLILITLSRNICNNPVAFMMSPVIRVFFIYSVLNVLTMFPSILDVLLLGEMVASLALPNC